MSVINGRVMKWHVIKCLRTFLIQAVLTVVCLRGGERGTCLGPPLFWGPPWGVTRV